MALRGRAGDGGSSGGGFSATPTSFPTGEPNYSRQWTLNLYTKHNIYQKFCQPFYYSGAEKHYIPNFQRFLKSASSWKLVKTWTEWKSCLGCCDTAQFDECFFWRKKCLDELLESIGRHPILKTFKKCSSWNLSKLELQSEKRVVYFVVTRLDLTRFFEIYLNRSLDMWRFKRCLTLMLKEMKSRRTSVVTLL